MIKKIKIKKSELKRLVREAAYELMSEQSLTYDDEMYYDMEDEYVEPEFDESQLEDEIDLTGSLDDVYGEYEESDLADNDSSFEPDLENYLADTYSGYSHSEFGDDYFDRIDEVEEEFPANDSILLDDDSYIDEDDGMLEEDYYVSYYDFGNDNKDPYGQGMASFEDGEIFELLAKNIQLGAEPKEMVEALEKLSFDRDFAADLVKDLMLGAEQPILEGSYLKVENAAKLLEEAGFQTQVYNKNIIKVDKKPLDFFPERLKFSF